MLVSGMCIYTPALFNYSLTACSAEKWIQANVVFVPKDDVNMQSYSLVWVSSYKNSLSIPT